MNPLNLFSLYRWALYLALAASLVFGYFAWERHIRADEHAIVVAEYNAKIDAQKKGAATVLAKALADMALERAAFDELKTAMEKTRETLQTQNAAALRQRLAGPRLQFTAEAPRCGGGGTATQSAAPDTTSDPGTAVVQLPEPLNRALLEYAADAQSLAIDYSILYTFVNNPALVCQLRIAAD